MTITSHKKDIIFARQENMMRQAVVVFSDQNSLPWQGFLARGFRHCFIAIQADCGWIVLDPLSNVMNLNCLAAISPDDLVAWYEAQGYKAVAVTVGPPPSNPAPWAVFTCVEAVKRVMGISARWIITPYYLWKYMIKENNP